MGIMNDQVPIEILEAARRLQMYFGSRNIHNWRILGVQAVVPEIMNPPDNPKLDGTDFAHPAWWRGYRQAVHTLGSEIIDILDGQFTEGIATEPWHTTAKKIEDLVEKAQKGVDK